MAQRKKLKILKKYTKKAPLLLRYIFGGLILVTILLAFPRTQIEPYEEHIPMEEMGAKSEVVIAVGPHHILAEDLIHNPFQKLKILSQDGKVPQNFDEVIIIGPNHFDLGLGPLLTASEDNPRFEGFRLSNLASKLSESSLISQTNGVFQNEHSIYTYLPVIQDYYPGARITPLVFKWSFPEERISDIADLLEKTIEKETRRGKSILILFSIDFSHFQDSKVTKLHDVKNLGVVESLETEESYNLEVDCRACVKLMLTLAEKFELYPLAQSGDSRLINKISYDYTGKEIPEGQTSYISGYFLNHGIAKEKRPVTMMAFGDLLLDRYVRTLIERHGQEYILDRLAGEEGRFFEGVDIMFANLEGPVTPNRVHTNKEIAFQFDPEFLNILTKHNFNLVSIANNHAYDMGVRGFEDTIQFLDDAGIPHVGNAKQVDHLSSYEIEKGGRKIGFAAFNHTDYKLNIDDALNLIRDLRTRNDFVVVSIHWGVEYAHVPSEFQKNLAKEMVEAGADVIIGHHPHVLQGMEYIDGRPVFYSLGNFVFDQWFSGATQETIGVGLSFVEPATETEPPQINLYLVPIQIEKAIPFQPNEEKAQEILSKFNEYSSKITR